MENSSQQEIEARGEVVKSGYNRIRERFDVLFLERGIKRADVYKALGYDKSYFCKVVNGQFEPTLSVKIKICQFLKVDTSVIWQEKER